MFDDKIEGRNPVIELLRSERDIDKIFIQKGEKSGSILKIISEASKKGIVIQKVDKNKLDKMSETHSHQGVIAVTSAAQYVELEDILEKSKNDNTDPFVVVLDEINDPHNMGSIIRTAEAVGVDGVIIPKRRSVGLSAIVAKASAGAVEYMKVCKVTNIARTIDELKDKGLWIVGLDVSGDTDIFNSDLKGPLAIVIGNEGKGISRLVREKCDFIYKIPMYGNIQSLNASVATGVILYEAVKQRK